MSLNCSHGLSVVSTPKPEGWKISENSESVKLKSSKLIAVINRKNGIGEEITKNPDVEFSYEGKTVTIVKK